MPVVIPLNITPKTQTPATSLGAQGRSVVSAYHNLTKPTNWWQRGMTSMLPGWMPKTGALTPPWSPKPISTPLDWATAYGKGIGGGAARPAPIATPTAIAPRSVQSLVNASNELWRPSMMRRR